MTLPTVIIADDSPAIVAALQGLLAGHCHVLATVSDGPSLVATAVAHSPDIIITDMSMLGFDGLCALRQLRQRRVRSKVIVVTMDADPEIASEALAAGASGYVLNATHRENCSAPSMTRHTASDTSRH